MIEEIFVNHDGNKRFQLEGTWKKEINLQVRNSVRLEVWFQNKKIAEFQTTSIGEKWFGTGTFEVEKKCKGVYWIYAYKEEEKTPFFQKEVSLWNRYPIWYNMQKKQVGRITGILLELYSGEIELEGTDIYYMVKELPYRYYFPFQRRNKFQCFICGVEAEDIKLYVGNKEKYIEFKERR